MDNLLLYKSTKVRIKNLSKKLKSKMIIFIFLVMCIERALSDNSLTLDALGKKLLMNWLWRLCMMNRYFIVSCCEAL